jgi:hypothetical protein
MCVEPNLDMTHSEIQNYVADRLRLLYDEVRTEQRLDNGKIADVHARIGHVTMIVEVKTVLRSSLILSAFQKYAAECSYLVVATPCMLEYDDSNHGTIAWANHQLQKVGLWQVDWLGIKEMRAPTCLR